jgi:hypothetical protein
MNNVWDNKEFMKKLNVYIEEIDREIYHFFEETEKAIDAFDGNQDSFIINGMEVAIKDFLLLMKLIVHKPLPVKNSCFSTKMVIECSGNYFKDVLTNARIYLDKIPGVKKPYCPPEIEEWINKKEG